VRSVGQRVAAGVPQHVRMRFEPELGLDSRTFDHARDPAVLNGAPRSEVNTNGDLGSCSR